MRQYFKTRNGKKEFPLVKSLTYLESGRTSSPRTLFFKGGNGGKMKIVALTIEQPNREYIRYQYNEKAKMFYETPYTFLPTLKGFTGAYGWLDETYMGPTKHLDAYYLTHRRCHLGDRKKGVLCGALFRNNGDHKFIIVDYTVMESMTKYDLTGLPKMWFKQLQKIFGNLSKDERWLNANEAIKLYEKYLKTNNLKNIKSFDTSKKDRLLVQRMSKNQYL